MAESDDVISTIRQDVGEDVDIHDSSNPEALFLTSRSKIELALIDYKEGVLARRKWVNPFVTFVTLLSVLVVADFQAFLGFSKEVWQAIFTIGTGISVLWLLKAIIEFTIDRGKAEVDYVIKELESDT